MNVEERDPTLDLPDPFRDEIARTALPAAPTLSPSPTRRERRRLRFVALGLAVLFEAGMLLLMGVRELDTVSSFALAAGVVAPLAGAWLALRAAAHGGEAGVGLSRTVVVGALLLTLAGFLVASAGHLAEPHLAVNINATIGCLVGSAMFTVAPLAFALVAFRHAFAAGAGSRSLLLGVAAGALAAAALELRCGAPGQLHFLLGHGAGMVVGGALGWAFQRVTRA